MDVLELKKEQLKLAPRVITNDGFTKLKTIGGALTFPVNNKLLGVVIVCEFPSFKILEKQTYLLDDPLPNLPGYTAYREMPALIEAYNKLEQEPDLLLVSGPGIAHPRKLGLASHLGLALNQPTMGLTRNLPFGKIEQGKIILHNEIVGFELKTREYANPVYASLGHLISLGSTLKITAECIFPPHKMPEPLHLARKVAKKEAEKILAKEPLLKVTIPEVQ